LYKRNAAHKMIEVPDFLDNTPCGCSIEHNFISPTYASYYPQSKAPSLPIPSAIYLNVAYEGKGCQPAQCSQYTKWVGGYGHGDLRMRIDSQKR
jgi:hypothetical protein